MKQFMITVAAIVVVEVCLRTVFNSQNTSNTFDPKTLKYDEWSAIAEGTIRIDMPGRKFWEVGVSWDGYKLLRNGNVEIKMFEIVDSNRWDAVHGKTPTQTLGEVFTEGE